MRKLILVTAAFVVAVIFFLLATLPPRPVRVPLDGVDQDLRRRTIAGAYHIHTTRSDGVDIKARVAAAAARAGLGFAIFADHGDGTRPSDPPAYIDGVLCIDAVEISTNGGHYVAIGLPAAPYPLGGEASAVVEDVARLGGLGIAAHPDHPKPELAWTDWSAPIDGLEWINADSEWRNESALALTRVAFNYLLRPAPAIASVLDRPERTLTRWDATTRMRPVIALAAVDAHGGARGSSPEHGEPSVSIGPSYEASFRTLSNRVLLPRPLTGEAGADARLLLDAIRAGSVYSVIDAISPDVVLAIAPDGFTARSPLPAGAKLVTVGEGDGRRLEIHVPGAPGHPPVPWVLTNWIGVRRNSAFGPPPAAPTQPSVPLATGEWRVEKDAGSSGHVDVADGAVTLRYELRPGARQSQFVAAAADLAEPAAFSRLVFRARAAQPMRVSVQLRFPEGELRWLKSVYIDREDREVTVAAGEMIATERQAGRMPAPETARSLLFVVDLVNAAPGATGAFTISDLRVAR
jgi:hypothetical protein